MEFRLNLRLFYIEDVELGRVYSIHDCVIAKDGSLQWNAPENFSPCGMREGFVDTLDLMRSALELPEFRFDPNKIGVDHYFGRAA